MSSFMTCMVSECLGIFVGSGQGLVAMWSGLVNATAPQNAEPALSRATFREAHLLCVNVGTYDVPAYVCMYATYDVPAYVRMYACVHVCRHVCMCACMHVCMHQFVLLPIIRVSQSDRWPALAEEKFGRCAHRMF